jgi:hypothetical protein
MTFGILGAASTLWNSTVGQTPQAPQQTSSASSQASQTSQTATTDPFSNLNLTASQNAKLQSILASAFSQKLPQSQVLSQIDAILSPQQQTALQGDLQQMHGSGHHHKHHGGGSGSSSTSSLDSGDDAFGVPAISAGAANASSSATAGQSLFSNIAASYAIQSQL